LLETVLEAEKSKWPDTSVSENGNDADQSDTTKTI